MVIRSEGAVEYVMVGVSRRLTQAIWRGKEIEPVQASEMQHVIVTRIVLSCGSVGHSTANSSGRKIIGRIQTQSGVLAKIRALRSSNVATGNSYTIDFM
ncbi:hypothetical protein TNCV_1442401 [Trichonephila clavipes]|uniref:Uncharacterized protein n=1 Tax=Trichonephila clavipes TaxID=2585209 RepID=A0A8X6RJP9_TRICX|nr:hypothetical protein TNCV_1442401 [Trichonephila clavipes]